MILHTSATGLHTDASGGPGRILLIGMMGSGKSSVGRALAELSGWPFVDNDTLVERASGMTARQLLADRGATAMRAAESAALGVALEMDPPCIAAVAAGTILDVDDRARMAKGGLVVWLRAPAKVLAARAVGADHRPWLADDPVRWFSQASDERDALYAGVADLVVDTSTTDPETAAGEILCAATIGP